MPTLDSCAAGKGYPKAGDRRNIYIAGFDFLPVKEGQKILLKGFFVDEEGQSYDTAFGYTTGIALDRINEILIALGKQPVDEVSISSISLPDKGAVPTDWSAPISVTFVKDTKDERYVRLGAFGHAI